MDKPKIKVFWYSDFLCPTGFGNVAEEIVHRLYKTGKYEFTVLGINFKGEPYHLPDSPYFHLKNIPVHPAEYRGDILGQQRLINFLASTDIDLLFVLQDTFNMAQLAKPLQALRAAKKYKHIYYFPVDGDLTSDWVNNSIKIADYPVAYTKYGVSQVKKYTDIELPIIYHGVDTDTFYPLNKKERDKFRKMYLKASPSDFVITNVNRNTVRKDFPRTIITWLQLRKEFKNVKLYLHADVKDHVGYDLARFIKQHVPSILENDIIYPDPEFMKKLSMPKKAMRSIYGMSDAVISTSLGEGWGLSTTEAMACMVPVVMPKHTSMVEIIGSKCERGYLASCSNFCVLQQHDNYQLRPMVDVDDMVRQIRSIITQPEVAAAKTEQAYKWVKANCDWDKIAKKWDSIFTEAYEAKTNQQ
jgi:glycosyltransferase involved in cell wall biosynthesis